MVITHSPIVVMTDILDNARPTNLSYPRHDCHWPERYKIEVRPDKVTIHCFMNLSAQPQAARALHQSTCSRFTWPRLCTKQVSWETPGCRRVAEQGVIGVRRTRLGHEDRDQVDHETDTTISN